MTIAQSTTHNVGRILGTPVPMLVPLDGPVHVLLVGEAPGPRGADKSGVPFLGDAAGKVLYDVLVRMGAMTLPPEIAPLAWDGSLFIAHGIMPVAKGVALGNAFDCCPTDDGATFRAPLRTELEGAANFARLTRDITHLRARGLKGIVTLGRVATRTIDVLFRKTPMPEIARRALPHPSAQGLLSMAPERGRGAKMADLQEAWMVRCQYAVIQAGYPASSPSPDAS
jgi:uracil-DNA glycosylase